MIEQPMNENPLMQEGDGKIVLFYPEISKNASKYVTDSLNSRWIGQGPKVDKFENQFNNKFNSNGYSLSCGSGTDALHLSYLLADLKPGDEVIAPLFTCTATNIALKYLGVKIVFADVEKDSLNIDVNHVRSLVNENTKAIVCVHYGGVPCDLEELNQIASENGIPVIEDAAHALGAKYNGKYIGEISDFTMFSFQAIKHLTTGDGGMVTMMSKKLYEKGTRLRWFGIDRMAKQKGIWENDIKEIGYKYQMNDIAASIGLANLEEFDEKLKLRKKLYNLYYSELIDFSDVNIIGGLDTKSKVNAAWMMTILVDNRKDLHEKLRSNNIESAQVHYRNDRYSIFGGRQTGSFPNMDSVENKYLVIPLHTKMKESDVIRVCNVIKSGW